MGERTEPARMTATEWLRIAEGIARRQEEVRAAGDAREKAEAEYRARCPNTAHVRDLLKKYRRAVEHGSLMLGSLADAHRERAQRERIDPLHREILQIVARLANESEAHDVN
jgi:hypothetical protein